MKSAETLLRRPAALLAVFLAPVFTVLLLAYVKGEAFNGVDDTLFPDSFELAPANADGQPALPECTIFDSFWTATRLDCIGLAYTWSGSEGTEALAESIASGLACTSEPCAQSFESPDALAEAFVVSPGKFDAGLIVERAGAAGFHYTLWKNTSSERAYVRELDDHMHYVKVQKAIEESALRAGLGAGASPLRAAGGVRATVRKLPEVGYTQAGTVLQTGLPDVVDTNAGTLMIFGLTISAVFAMQLIAQEKRDGLLGLLRMTGLRESTYWLSWMLCLAVAYMLSGLVTAIAGGATSVELFNMCNLGVHMLAAFFYSTASCAFILIGAAAVKEPWAVQGVQFVVVLFNVLFQTFVSQSWFRGSASPMDFWTGRSMRHPDFSIAEKIAIFFFPAFHYGKIIQNIYDVTGVEGGRSTLHSLDPRLAMEPVRDYNWSNVHQPVGWQFGEDYLNETIGFQACFEGTPAYAYGCKGIVKACTNATYTLPDCPEGVLCNTESECDWIDFRGVRVGSWYGDPVSDSFWFLIADTLIFLLVAWYIAQVFSAGTGSAKPVYFPFLPSYWTGIASVGVDETEGRAAQEKELSLQDGSTRLLKLSKSYAETTALKELTLVMNRGEVFCLLGHNGAGKTTTINILTGLHPPTHGEAFVQGMSVRSAMAQIQAIMGVCPQDNVLFEGISGRSHLRFWGRFKGMARSSLREEADRLLEGVGLLDKASVAATSYSGGMKRRLSVAIASVAAPSIVFLDEPTTGLDPLSRMRTWASISKLKTDRIVCLTTHSMEEADCLGDNIGILAGGRLRALGAPLFLKGRFGSGYHITLLCDEAKSDDVLALLKKCLPLADIISNVTGHITVGVPQGIFHLVSPFFAKLEEADSSGNRLVNEWSISASTLEEVFLKVAVQNHAVNAEVEGQLIEASPAAASHLVAGLHLNALEGLPVHMTLLNKQGMQVEFNSITSIMCSEQADKDERDDAALAVPVAAKAAAAQAKGEGLAAKQPGTEPPTDGAGDASADAAAVAIPVLPAEANATPRAQEADVPQAATVVAVGAASDAVPAVDCTFLPPSDNSVIKPPSSATQIRGLILKSATLQRKQPIANLFRGCCTVCLVLFAVLFNVLMLMLFAGGGGGSAQSCLGRYVVRDDNFVMFAADRQGSEIRSAEDEDRLWADYVCLKEDLKAFYLGAEICKEVPKEGEQLSEAMLMPSFSSTSAAEVSAAEVLLGAYGYKGSKCPGMFQQETVWPNCPDLGTTELHGACNPGPQIPDVCAIDGFEMLFRQSEHEPWMAAMMKSDDRDSVANQLATKIIWHEGAFDMSWLGGDMGENRFVRANSSDWWCGGARVDLREVNSIEEAFLEAQQAQATTARQPVDLGCQLSREGQSWDPQDNLAINPMRQDETVAWSEEGSKQVLDDFRSKFPDIGVNLKTADIESGLLDYDVWVYGARTRRDGDPNTWRERDYPFVRTAFKDQDTGGDACMVVTRQTTAASTLHQLVSGISDSLLQKLWQNAGSGGEAPRISSRVVALPKIQFSSFSRQWSAFIVLNFLPVVSMMFFPVMTHTVQSECVERNVMAMQIQSLRLVNYWVATYAWNYFLYAFNITLFYICNLAAGVTAFKYANHGLFVVVLLLWGHAQIALASFMATALGRSKLTTVLTYMIIVGTMITGPMLAMMNFGKRWSTFLLLLPPLNFVRGVMLVLLKGPGEMSSDEESEFGEICGLQFAIGTALFAIGVALHAYRQGTFSLSEALSTARLRGKETKASAEASSTDEDVLAEAKRVAAADSAEDVVRVRDLVKEYPGGHQAVQGVSFGIPTNSCFGLLGPNGAGKTTIISMLSGSQAITGGEARVGGFDARREMRRIHQVLGICPQFDIVWRDLTVFEHLLLFARIKGMPRLEERALARQVAEAVGLDGDPLRMLASQLSGGMRRRLSLGIALIANPRVVFLDEPSTGLDPETRQGLWRIISNITRGRCVVLTTHSMEEADALCDCIGIMALGRLRCLGTPMHLKGKFGQGYQLSISLKAEVARSAGYAQLDAFVRERISTAATVLESWKGNSLRTYCLPKGSVKVSQVFESMTETVKKELGIQEWSLNQTSLNEVFLRIAKESEQ